MINNSSKFLIGIMFVLFIFHICCDSGEKEQMLIELKAVEKREAHPIIVQDILSTRELHEPRISPDGREVAFIIKQAFPDLNDYRSALYIIETDGSSGPIKLLEEKALSGIRWSPDGKYVTYLSSKNGSSQVWSVNDKGGKPSQLFHHVTGISRYEWSPDGSKIAFLSSDSVTSEEKERVAAQGVLYSDKLWYRDIIEKSYIKKPLQLWIYDLQKQTEEKVWEHTSSIYKIAWSPDAKNIALSYVRSDKPEEWLKRVWDIGVISLKQRRRENVSSRIFRTGNHYDYCLRYLRGR